MIATPFRDVILSLGRSELEPEDVNLHTKVMKEREMKAPYMMAEHFELYIASFPIVIQLPQIVVHDWG